MMLHGDGVGEHYLGKGVVRKGARVIVVGTPPPQSSGTGYWAGDMFVAGGRSLDYTGAQSNKRLMGLATPLPPPQCVPVHNTTGYLKGCGQHILYSSPFTAEEHM